MAVQIFLYTIFMIISNLARYTSATNLTLGSCVEGLPGHVELNIVFPRNDTYKPIAFLPIVFLIPNSDAVWAFDLVLRWSLQDQDGNFIGNSSNNGIQPLAIRNSVPFVSDDLVIVNSTTELKNRTGQWTLSWTFGLGQSCFGNATNVVYSTNNTLSSGSMKFSTSDSGKLPEIPDGNPCPDYGADFMLESCLPGTPVIPGSPHLCPVLRTPQTSLPNPCFKGIGVGVGSIVSTSMMAAAQCTTTEYFWPNITASCKSGSIGIHGRGLLGSFFVIGISTVCGLLIIML